MSAHSTNLHDDTMDLVSRLKAADEAFALATVVRTVSVTAAKAGAGGPRGSVFRARGGPRGGAWGGPPAAVAVMEGTRPDIPPGPRRFIVVSTQGKGDEAALRAAVTVDAAYHAFVGSRRKMAALRQALLADGVPAAALERVKAPAGLDLGAITPEEIALSILADVIRERRLDLLVR